MMNATVLQDTSLADYADSIVRQRVDPRRDPSSQHLRSLLREAEAARQAGLHQSALEIAYQAAELAQQMDDRSGAANAQHALAINLFRLGELEDALRAGERAVRLAEPLGDAQGLSFALGTLSLICGELGLYDEALRRVSACLDAAQLAGDKTTLFWAYHRIGIAHDAIGSADQAQAFFERALLLAREIQDTHSGEALFAALNSLASNALGRIASQRSQIADTALVRAGLSYAEESIRVARQSGSLYRTATGLLNHGALLGLNGQHARALETLAEGLAYAMAQGYRPLEVRAATETAEVLCAAGAHNDAVALLTAMLDTHAKTHADGGETRRNSFARLSAVALFRALSQACKQAGRFAEALTAYEHYHALERGAQMETVQANARALTGRLDLDHVRMSSERAQLEEEMLRLRHVEQLVPRAAPLVARNPSRREPPRPPNEDPLTRLQNRRFVEVELPRRFAQAKVRREPLSSAVAEIDHFKRIQEQHGRALADRMLTRLAAIFITHCRPSDVVARYGDERFLMLFTDTPGEAAVSACERLRRAVEQDDWASMAPGLAVTISLGLCDALDAVSAQQMLARADVYLYKARRNGHNRIEPGAAPVSANPAKA